MTKLSAPRFALLITTFAAFVLVQACTGDDGGGNGGEGEGEGVPLPAECAEPTNKPNPTLPSGVYFGSRTPTLVPLSAAQQNAVVGISDDADAGAFCSGTLIAPTVVLTAQHCTEGYDGDQLVVLFGPDDYEPLHVVATTEKFEHPSNLDIAMLVLASDPTGAISVETLPVATAAPSLDDIGARFEASGYGETHDGSHGRYFVTERFEDLSANLISVDGGGARGVCYGDSGGPLMQLIGNGEVRVAGVLAFGDTLCMNDESFQRTDAVLSWIEDHAGTAPAAEPIACPVDLDDTGHCDPEQAQATWCEAGAVASDACGAGEICADDGNGYRCIAAGSNACGAVSGFGACEGDTLQWCDGGTVRTRDCGSCAEKCLFLDATQGYGCVPSDCGDLTSEGQCVGTVASWCDVFGQKQTYNCHDENTTCEYIGEQTGYYCQDDAYCQGLDYGGECDGNTLRYCEDYEIIEVDCQVEYGTNCVALGGDDGFDCE